MAEPLKNYYDISVATRIAHMLQHVESDFDSKGFIDHVQQRYEQLELMARGRKIAAALKVFLPSDFEKAVAILSASLDVSIEHDENNSLASFIFMPTPFMSLIMA